MPSICFLTSTRGTPRNDNHRRLPAAWSAAGWDVTTADHDDVGLGERGVCIAGDVALAGFDLIWPIGLGARDTFLDRMQLLATLDPDRFVTRPQALLAHHSKYSLAVGDLARHHPKTYASRDPAWLSQIVEAGGDWIAKPPAASFGREVYRLHANDPNLRVILEALTGHDRSRYCLLQRYVEEIERGELRVLVADGCVIGAYRRTPGLDHRVNLSGDGRAEVAHPSGPELELARMAAETLSGQGIGYAAIDIAYPWIIEFNVANPGGLETLERLTGEDLAPRVVAPLAMRPGVLNGSRRTASTS